MEWFRLYTEARNDAKLRSLNDAQFRVWFNLLCLAADQPERGVIEGRKFSLVAVECAGGEADLLAQTLGLLSDLEILHCDWPETEETSCPRITFIHFKKRQYTKPSDHPERVAERVNRRKTLNRAESRRIAPETETETDSDSKTETENKRKNTPFPPQAGGLCSQKMNGKVLTGTETSVATPESTSVPPKDAYSVHFERFWREEYPRHEAKATAWRVWKRLGLDTDIALLRRIIQDVRQRRQEPPWRANGGLFIPQLTNYLQGRRWEDSLPSPAQQRSSPPTVTAAQPMTYAQYRKRLEAYLAMEEIGAPNEEPSLPDSKGERLSLILKHPCKDVQQVSASQIENLQSEDRSEGRIG